MFWSKQNQSWTTERIIDAMSDAAAVFAVKPKVRKVLVLSRKSFASLRELNAIINDW